MRGYETARVLCLSISVDAARHHKSDSKNPAYESGFDWGLWDYEDANGLPHESERGA